MRYHSHFTASVIEDKKAILRPMEIVAHGRLGTATKKAHLLCSWDEETEEEAAQDIVATENQDPVAKRVHESLVQ